jgi:glutamate/tyrosine decarboxylase-like PLP-dependent enzyme
MQHRPTALFPSAEQCRQTEARLTAALEDFAARIPNAPVTPTLDIPAFRNELAGFDFRAPQSLDTLLAWVIDRLQSGLVQITHPRYFGLFNPAPTFPAICADRIVAAFNPQLASATTSPAAVEIEAQTIRAIAARAGLPEGCAGHFTSGGSEANCTALICALTTANPGFAQMGTRCFGGPPVFYVSRDSHLAWIKIAHQTGIGRSAVRLVATDGAGHMSADALTNALVEDRARGHVPVMIAATAGTTAAGMIDPLPECARIARSAGVWFHVDAAWGGALIASERHRSVLAGIELADSLTIDAHKWFATTMACGMFITRHAACLPAAFRVQNDFMPPNDATADPYVTSLQWSRRFLGLRLFLALAAAGWEGYAEHVERATSLAALLKHRLESLGWTVVNDSQLAVLCILPPPGSPDPATIVRRVLASGSAWISTAAFESRPVIRACITNGTTTEQDLDILLSALTEACSRPTDTALP